MIQSFRDIPYQTTKQHTDKVANRRTDQRRVDKEGKGTKGAWEWSIGDQGLLKRVYNQ